MSRAVRFAPLALFVLLVVSLIWRLSTPVDTTVKSRMVGKLVPDLVVPAAFPGQPARPLRNASCGPVVINFFASWCVPCIAEAKKLAELKRQGVPIVGIAVRDRPDDVAAFLARNGNPYEEIGSDPQSKVQIAFGSSGVPETFVIDGRGVMRHQYVGALTAANIPGVLRQMEEAR